jgi:hypothetical protein
MLIASSDTWLAGGLQGWSTVSCEEERVDRPHCTGRPVRPTSLRVWRFALSSQSALLIHHVLLVPVKEGNPTKLVVVATTSVGAVPLRAGRISLNTRTPLARPHVPVRAA